MFVRKSNWTVLSVIYACTVLVSLCFAFLDSSVSAADAKGISFFEQHIRPLLIDQCLECHTSEKLKGGLRLDTLQGMLEGGDSGRAAITPGDPKTSLMIKAVQYSNAELQMPPKNKLGKRTIEHLREWIAMGAPWPGESSHSIDTTARSQDGEEANKEGHAPEIKQDYWAFQPLPDQHFASLDEVIESRLSEKQLTPNPEASRRTLIRRAYFGLIGLPPTHAEVESFEAMLIFVRTKTATVELSAKLEARGYASNALNGDIKQNQRERIIDYLKSGKLEILVAAPSSTEGLPQ